MRLKIIIALFISEFTLANHGGEINIKTTKMTNALYIFGIVVIAISIVLIIEYPNYQRVQLIAGGFVVLGFVLNVTGYSLKDKNL